MGALESATVAFLLILPRAGIASAGARPLRHEVVLSERLYLATMAGDVGTTYYGLETRQMTERNPILRPFENRPAIVMAAQAGMVAGYVWVARKVGRKHPRAIAALHLALSVVNVASAVNNLRVVADYQRRLDRRAREQR
jgi:hypothetical protein